MYRFIIADDETMIVQKLLKLVNWEEYGFTCIGDFADGKKALDFLETNSVDLLITDIKMPNISGLELAEYLSYHSPDTSVILISAYRDFRYATEAMRHGVRSYLTKPISTTLLKEELVRTRSYLDKKKLHPNDNNSKTLIIQAQEYIRQNCGEALTLKKVASHINISPNYLSALFKQKAGVNFSTYITNARIEEAKKLLLDPTLKIYNICFMVGYKNISHFHQVFKEHTGLSPNEYRKKI